MATRTLKWMIAAHAVFAESARKRVVCSVDSDEDDHSCRYGFKAEAPHHRPEESQPKVTISHFGWLEFPIPSKTNPPPCVARPSRRLARARRR